MFGPERILTACHTTNSRAQGCRPRDFSFTMPSSSLETPFLAGTTQKGGRLRGLCFSPFQSW